jgi:hypothetical protein
MLQPAFLGGLFIGVLSALPILNVANCCCLWIVAGGALAAHLLQQTDPHPIGVSRAATVGLLSGVIGAGVWLVISIALDAIMAPLQERMVDMMVRNSADLPPDVREVLDTLANRAGGPMRLAVGFAFLLVTGTVFATLGAVIAASVMRPHPNGRLTPPPVPPQ